MVLCANGLMIPKDNYKVELWTEFKNFIREKLGFDLKISKKQMDQGYKIDQLEETQIKAKELSKEWDLSEAEF